MSLCVCLSVCVPLWLSLWMYVCLSVSLWLYVYVCLSVSLSVSLWLYVCLSVSVFLCVCVCVCVFLSTSLWLSPLCPLVPYFLLFLFPIPAPMDAQSSLGRTEEMFIQLHIHHSFFHLFIYLFTQETLPDTSSVPIPTLVTLMETETKKSGYPF